MNLTKMCILLLVGTASFFSVVPYGVSATVLVEDYGDGTPAYTNVLAACNAADAGDTIIFPADGSATWSSTLVIEKPITLDGSGTTLTAGAGLPIEGFFHVTNFSSNALLRITGFEFNLVDFTAARAAIAVAGNIALDALRIDHHTF